MGERVFQFHATCSARTCTTFPVETAENKKTAEYSENIEYRDEYGGHGTEEKKSAVQCTWSRSEACSMYIYLRGPDAAGQELGRADRKSLSDWAKPDQPKCCAVVALFASDRYA